MNFIDPRQVFQGKVMVVAPHMDDEVLACGGTIACLSEKHNVNVVYVTDGTKSPVPIYPWLGKPSPDLASIRMEEAKAAMGVLGVLEDNTHFLGLPDGRLRFHQEELIRALVDLIDILMPDNIFVPFRYDRHADHLALNHAIHDALKLEKYGAEVIEYFVYNRYRLLPGGDIRELIRPDQLIKVDIRDYSTQKKKALLRYKSQTMVLYAWQNRPILTQERVEEVSLSPEVFLRYDGGLVGSAVFAHSRVLVGFVHKVEPVLKYKKEQLLALFNMGSTLNDRKPK